MRKKIIGLKRNIIIDSGIFKHNILDYDHLLDESKDIIEIFGNEDKPIELDDVIDAYTEMQNQFNEIKEKSLEGWSYFYEGMTYYPTTGMYHIHWGS